MDADERLRSFCGAIDRSSAHHTLPLESGLFEIEQDGKAQASHLRNVRLSERRDDLWVNNICVHLRYLR